MNKFHKFGSNSPIKKKKIKIKAKTPKKKKKKEVAIRKIKSSQKKLKHCLFCKTSDFFLKNFKHPIFSRKFMTSVSRKQKDCHSKSTIQRVSQKSDFFCLVFFVKVIELCLLVGLKKGSCTLWILAWCVKRHFSVYSKNFRKQNSTTFEKIWRSNFHEIKFAQNTKISMRLTFQIYNFYLSISTMFGIKHTSNQISSN